MSTPKSGDEEAKKGRMGRYMIEENDAEQFVSCVYSPYFVVIACILTVYQSINAKRSPYALYQNMRTKLFWLDYDTGDDASCWGQDRVHLHPVAYSAIIALPIVYRLANELPSHRVR